MRCDYCDDVVSFTFKGNEIVDYYPKRSYKIDQSIPSDVSVNYSEALRCFDNLAFTATVVMCRRAIEIAAVLKGGSGASLQKLIESVIPSDLRPLADEIRHWGNRGAHFDKEIANITKSDAQQILEFAEKMFWYLFVMPAQISNSKTRRNPSP